MKKKHPKEAFKLKISENNLTRYHFRKETTVRMKTVTNDDDDDDKFEEQQQANVIILSLYIPISTASTINTVTSPSISTLGTSLIPSTPSNLRTSSSPTKNFKSPNSIQDQLILMAKKLSRITDDIENIHLGKTSKDSSSSSSSTQADDMEQIFDPVKCSDDFFMLKSLEINNQCYIGMHHHYIQLIYL